jgi:hypothetical protein
MALGLTMPLRVSTKNIPGGISQRVHNADNLTVNYEPTA